MKLYMHPVSMTSRPVRLFIAENKYSGRRSDRRSVHGRALRAGLYRGQSEQPRADDRRRRPEADRKLRDPEILADKIGSPAYPKDLKQRAKVNEMMDWLNTNFYRDLGLQPRLSAAVPQSEAAQRRGAGGHHRDRPAERQALAEILNDYWIGPDKQYLCGNQITIADYFGAALVTLGEVIRCDLSAYPNVQRWLNNMKKLPSWGPVNEVFHGLVASVKEQPFHAI